MNMDSIMITILVTNLVFIFFTMIEKIYKNHEHNRKYKLINNYVSTNLENMETKAKIEYDTYLLGTNKDEMIDHDFNTLKLQNQKTIRETMLMLYSFFPHYIEMIEFIVAYVFVKKMILF